MCWLSLDFLYGPIPILIKGKGVGDTLETFGHKTYLHVGKKIKITLQFIHSNDDITTSFNNYFWFCNTKFFKAGIISNFINKRRTLTQNDIT